MPEYFTAIDELSFGETSSYCDNSSSNYSDMLEDVSPEELECALYLYLLSHEEKQIEIDTLNCKNKNATLATTDKNRAKND